MKLIVTQVDGSPSGLLLYHPEYALRAMILADNKGWDEERRIASQYIPLGEVWYTEDPSLNELYDLMMATHLDNLEAAFA